MKQKIQINSGGQTGADLGGLIGATLACAKTSGWCPKGFRTELGSIPALSEFGLKETTSKDYPQRTGFNVADSDITVIISEEFKSRGTLLTIKYCKSNNKPYLLYKPATGEITMSAFLSDLTPRIEAIYKIKQDTVILNVAGNRESTSPGLQTRVTEMVKQLCLTLNGNTVDEDLEYSLFESMKEWGIPT